MRRVHSTKPTTKPTLLQHQNAMRLRTIAALAILLLAPQDTVAFKQIGLWTNSLNSEAEKEIGARVNGAAASGFLRPEDMRAAGLEQPKTTAEALLKENEENTVHFAVTFMQFCSLACCSFWLLRVLAWMINVLFINDFFPVLLMLWSIKDVKVNVSRSGRSNRTTSKAS